MTEISAINIARILKIHRKKSGLSQKALAELAGVGKNVVFDIEKGKTSFQMDSLLKIIHVLNIQLYANGPFISEIKEIDDAESKSI